MGLGKAATMTKQYNETSLKQSHGTRKKGRFFDMSHMVSIEKGGDLNEKYTHFFPWKSEDQHDEDNKARSNVVLQTKYHIIYP